jgi:hypothetical protein
MSQTYRHGLSIGCDDDDRTQRNASSKLTDHQNIEPTIDMASELVSLRTELRGALDAKISALWKEIEKRDAAHKIAMADAVAELKDLFWNRKTTNRTADTKPTRGLDVAPR